MLTYRNNSGPGKCGKQSMAPGQIRRGEALSTNVMFLNCYSHINFTSEVISVMITSHWLWASFSFTFDLLFWPFFFSHCLSIERSINPPSTTIPVLSRPLVYPTLDPPCLPTHPCTFLPSSLMTSRTPCYFSVVQCVLPPNQGL